jgi:hypothetical protein
LIGKGLQQPAQASTFGRKIENSFYKDYYVDDNDEHSKLIGHPNAGTFNPLLEYRNHPPITAISRESSP